MSCLLEPRRHRWPWRYDCGLWVPLTSRPMDSDSHTLHSAEWCPSRQVQRTVYAATVHKLGKYLRTTAEHPSVTGLRKQPRHPQIAQTIRRVRYPFRNNQPCPSSLAVILRHQGIGNIIQGPAPRHRRHHQTILQDQRTR